MKIIEGLKQIKDLARKADDIRTKISTFCADMEIETPAYGTTEQQTKQIAEWLQSHHDIIKEIESLRIRIQKTNLAVMVPISFGENKTVLKSIAGWIHRRKDLAKLESNAWYGLSNKRLLPQAIPKDRRDPNSEVEKIINVRKYYDQKERDKMVEQYTAEPSKIDAALEIINATTDLME
jgi:hypothetical protein